MKKIIWQLELIRIKKETSDLFQSLGLDLSTAIGMFYIQALRCHDVPFYVVADEEPNRKIYMTMKDAENDTNMSGPFESIAFSWKCLFAEEISIYL